MNFILATDDNFVQHCCVTMTSILRNNNDVHFFIFTEELSPQNAELLCNHTKSFGGTIEICKVDSNIVSRFPMPANADAHISVATYYRLFAALILPESIDKAIYMDCDMVVRKSFKELWDEPIEGYAVGAVFQSKGESQTNDKKRLHIPEQFGYFNAGLLLINLKYWREHSVTDRLMDYIRDYYATIHQHDQDVLNAVLYSEVKPISYTWNFLPLFFDVEKREFVEYVDYSCKITSPANIHFVSAPKPWDYGCSNPFKDEYYKYLDMTPFKGSKPKFVLSKFYRDVLYHKLVALIATLDIFNIRKRLNLRRIIKK